MFLSEEQKKILEDVKRSMKEERIRLLQEQVDEVMRMGRPEDSWWLSLGKWEPKSFKDEKFGSWGEGWTVGWGGSVAPGRTQHSKMTVTFEDGTIMEFKNCTVIQKRDGIEIRASVLAKESNFGDDPLIHDLHRYKVGERLWNPSPTLNGTGNHVAKLGIGGCGSSMERHNETPPEIPKNIKFVHNPVPNYIAVNTPEMKGVFEVPKEDSDICRCNIMASGCTCGVFKQEQEAKNG